MNLSFVHNILYRQFSSYHRVMNLSFVQNILYRQFSSYHSRHETVIIRVVKRVKVAKLYSCGLRLACWLKNGCTLDTNFIIDNHAKHYQQF